MNARRDLRSVALASIAIAFLQAVVSLAGLLLGAAGWYGNPGSALGPKPLTAGILVPGFLGHDAFNLLVVAPILLSAVYLARRGNPVALLLWPGALYYTLYTYAIYLIGAPFSGLFLFYALLVALSAFTSIGIVAAIDGGAVRERLEPSVRARLVGGLLVALALVTIAQDTSGAIGTALGAGAPADPLARPVWAVDLSVEVPAVLIGGVLLWRRTALGYVAGAGLLLQYGFTPVALAFGLIVQALVAGSAVDWGNVLGVLGFAVVCFAPLKKFVGANVRRSVSSDRSFRRAAA